jgi:hypothetical protein
VKAGVWRLLRMLLTSLIAAIKPHPSLATIQAKSTALRRHLREPATETNMPSRLDDKLAQMPLLPYTHICG